MGTLTNQQMQEEVAEILGNRDELTVATGSRMERYLNFAQIQIARGEVRRGGKTLKVFWEELETEDNTLSIAKSAQTIAFPADLRYSLSLVLEDGDTSVKLRYLTPQKFDERFPKAQDAAASFTERQPIWYTHWAKSWEVWPVSDAAYDITARYGKWPTPLSTLSQKSDLDKKDQLLIQLTAADLWAAFGNTERSTTHFNIFNAKFEQAVADALDKPGRVLLPDFELGEPLGEYWRDPFIRSVS